MATNAAFAIVVAALGSSLLTSAVSAGAHPAGYQYVCPLPDSRLVSPLQTITLREGSLIDRSSLDSRLVVVAGSVSGPHAGRLVLADDGRTLVFWPETPFEPDERVAVRVLAGIRTADGRPLAPAVFVFTIAPRPARPRPGGPLESLAAEMPELRAGFSTGAAARPARARDGQACEPLPADYPTLTLANVDHPDPGGLFVAPFTFNFAHERGDMVILDNRGQPLFWRSWPTTSWDFKRQPDGLLTFFTLPATFIAMDSTYAVVDSFKTGNGYVTDVHDLQILPNGHALLMSYDWQRVRMDLVVPGGNPDALVAGLIIQELDTAKNVLFQWRSWDHFEITDADTCIEKLTGPTVDYVHGNAVELDQDGNILISSRHMSEITKIDIASGAVIWRFGSRAKHNEFTFLGDPRGFSHQHDIRRLPNGHLSLFDNGNCLDPVYSRALEYEIDEDHKIATLVAEHRQVPDTYGAFMGNAQHREGGGITIGWGGAGPDPKVTEVHADGSTALELGFGSPTTWTYRAFRFPWSTSAFVTNAQSIDYGLVAVGEASTRRLAITNRLPTPLAISCLISTDPAFSVTAPSPLTLPPGATDSVDVTFSPTLAAPVSAGLYVRTMSDTVLIAQSVELAGAGSNSRLGVGDVSLAEGQSGLTPFVFTIALQATTDSNVTVHYQTQDGTATVAGGDYLAVSGVALINAGQLSTTVTVMVVGDTLAEVPETFTLALSSPSHAAIVDGSATGTIVGDEPTLGVEEPGLPARHELRLAQPNPSRGETQLRYDLPRAGHVLLEVYDLRGRKVETLVDGVVEAGRHVSLWRPRGAPAGMYYIRMKAGDFTRTRSVVLIR
jgi:hypothetical protein